MVASVPETPHEKTPWRIRAGKLGAAKRWGPQRIVRLASLDPITREIVTSILRAREHAAAAQDADAPPDRAG